MSEQKANKFEGREVDQTELAYRQAVQYGQELAALYKQEKERRQALEIAYRKLETALESMSDGFMVVDKSLHITEMNKACADLFDLPGPDVPDKTLPDLLTGPTVPAFCQRLRTAPAAPFTTQLDIEHPFNQTLSIHVAPLLDSGWILVLRNLTWQQRLAHMREEFLQLTSHELKTPLASVIGFTSLLSQTADEHDLPPQTQTILHNILTAAEKLHRAINKLLDSSISAADEVDVEVVDLRDTVAEALTRYRPLADQHRITLQTTLPDEAMNVVGNKKMLTTALEQLVENGILYNKAGGTLTIRGEVCDGLYCLHVTDTGQGIARRELEYITQPFFQSQPYNTRRSAGMGLGLFIAQQTARLHRGGLEVSSRLGEGSTFTLTLPRFTAADLNTARHTWLAIQNDLSTHAEREHAATITQAQNIIQQLQQQLEIMQSQNLAYARDLAKLYQMQKAGQKTIQSRSAQLSHTERLALMGQLAAGVAHDLSNLIGPILGYSQIILRRRDAIDPNLADIIERIFSTSRRANTLLRQMVSLSRSETDQFEPFDLNKLVADMLRLLDVKIRYANVEVVEEYAENLPAVCGSSVQISQVILNLVINAIDAMPDGGILRLKTTPPSPDEPGFVRLEVADTGCGIPPENLERIFEAFFTTKKEKSGTGLGLSVTKQIVDNHGGKIQVTSTVGKGTTFTILLPTDETGEA